jgi:hypothetical protein
MIPVRHNHIYTGKKVSPVSIFQSSENLFDFACLEVYI